MIARFPSHLTDTQERTPSVGAARSPATTFAVDIDGTLCTQRDGDYVNAVPNLDAVRVVNRLYDEGDRIVLFTARFMGRADDDASVAEGLGRAFTERQLASWGVLYHELRFGKPRYALIIDDRSPFFRPDWERIYQCCVEARGAQRAGADLDRLRERTWRANVALAENGLVILSEGNASMIDDTRARVAIKPSGVPYDAMTKNDIVVLGLFGQRLAGALAPSVDAPSHLAIYRRHPWVKAIVHTHSPFATIFAQRRRPIPCLGTTHADEFAGAIPLCRELDRAELAPGAYEEAIGGAIADVVTREVPAALVP
jgi:L-ribulose-5-phosphate 4-epimerase